MTVADRRARFAALHAAGELFVMPNPWDAGSARLLASFGFEALATTSAGFALSLGRLDQNVSRDELVAHVEVLAAATPLPLNVDSERCFPDDPGGVSETVTLLAAAGARSEEHTSELQSPCNLVCRLLLEKKKKEIIHNQQR